MKDLLKEAIADAKAVRETALQNAKLALEEAFTPRLQSMISAKIAEEMGEDDEPTDQEIPEDGCESTEGAPAPAAAPAEGGEGTEGETEPEVKEGEGEEFGEKDGGETPEATMEPEQTENDDLDLDEIIKELELDSSEIGDGNNEVDAEKPAHDDVNPTTEGETETAPEGSEGDEDINIDEIVASLREADESAEEKEDEPTEKELEEAYNVIRFLKGKINEVNLLNAKLLYSNKLFRNFALNEGQKMKVIENFDRTHSVREVKLVYATLAEGFKMPAVGTKKVVKEGFASKPVASTKPAKQNVISEGADLAARFKHLAGMKKK